MMVALHILYFVGCNDVLWNFDSLTRCVPTIHSSMYCSIPAMENPVAADKKILYKFWKS